MAAAARPPGLGDARVPCPLCGGLIHPVAGRCKHCKEDLSAFRAGRPQAAIPLPALSGAAPTIAPAATSAYVPTAVPVAVPAAHEGSQPILPPRPTGRSMSAQRPRGKLVDKWPMIVIVVAVIAIVAAVVIMVMPAGNGGDKGKRQLMPTPAPDRMQTNPMPPKASQVDPWGGSTDPDPDPRGRPLPPPPPDPDPSADPDDLFGGLGAGGLGNSLGGGTFMITMAHAACAKLQGCPSADVTALQIVCDQFTALPRPPVPASCPSAQRCLDAIDQLSCSATLTNNHPLYTVYQLKDCVRAISEC